jgi:hypothetical protein
MLMMSTSDVALTVTIQRTEAQDLQWRMSSGGTFNPTPDCTGHNHLLQLPVTMVLPLLLATDRLLLAMVRLLLAMVRLLLAMVRLLLTMLRLLLTTLRLLLTTLRLLLATLRLLLTTLLRTLTTTRRWRLWRVHHLLIMVYHLLETATALAHHLLPMVLQSKLVHCLLMCLLVTASLFLFHLEHHDSGTTLLLLLSNCNCK